MGLKSNKELYNGSICCSVHEKEGKIVFLPTINMGTVGGFQHNLDKKVEINSDASIEDVCNTLVEALRRCEYDSITMKSSEKNKFTMSEYCLNSYFPFIGISHSVLLAKTFVRYLTPLGVPPSVPSKWPICPKY